MPAESSITPHLPSLHDARWVFVFTALVAAVFAGLTNHCWEDFYITFRASKNLVLGHGLVFQPGEHVHSYTSPLGVLLPALSSWLTGTTHDQAALWVFRGFSILALAGTLSVVYQSGRAWGWNRETSLAVCALLATDAKSVDYSINGMETGFLLLFLALAVHAHARGGAAGWWKLGMAWAGLMWTRPDAFIYIGGLAGGMLLFPSAQRIATTRAGLVAAYIRAGLVCTLIYLPWFVWAWWYYGSPVPHTVLAKGLAVERPATAALLIDALLFVARTWHSGPLDYIFSPANWYLGGWSVWAIRGARILAWLACISWLLPRMRSEARALSLAFMIGAFYLSEIWLFAWYIPPATLLAAIALGAMSDQVRTWFGKNSRAITVWRCVWASVIFGSSTLLVCTGWQIYWQQRVIETQRQEIGEWLRRQSAPGESVFLEPLGYIGYFSQLKMLDYPGLASPEVVAARRKVGDDWTRLIPVLKPDWLVFRPSEPYTDSKTWRPQFDRDYELIRTFDVSGQVAALSHVPGHNYLLIDQTFHVYHRRKAAHVTPVQL